MPALTPDSSGLQPSLEALYDHAPVGYLTTDAAGTVLLINQTLLDWLGQSKPQVIGQLWHNIFLSRIGRILLETHARPLLEVQGALTELLMDLLKQDGMRLPVLANINRRTVAIATGTNEVLLDYAFIRAVDRLHYEKKLLSAKHHADDMAEQLRELAADLEQMVAQRTAELMSANRDLDSFAYTVSHDLRAPLRAVNGYCDVLLEDAGPRLDPTSQGYVGQIQRAVTSMNAMIDGLLQLSMGARAELQIQDVDLSRLARQIYQELQQAQPARRVICQIQEQLTARGDARLLEVVLRNLIGNAWKYSARAAQPTICFSAQDVDGVRQYCVTDNGVGFDMTQSDKLFQVFTRLPGVSDFPGIGIGLATVQRIIERHDGKVSARSIPGEGAEFFFTLPVAAVADGANVRSK